jgi:hypothetical protein
VNPRNRTRVVFSARLGPASPRAGSGSAAPARCPRARALTRSRLFRRAAQVEAWDLCEFDALGPCVDATAPYDAAAVRALELTPWRWPAADADAEMAEAQGEEAAEEAAPVVAAGPLPAPRRRRRARGEAPPQPTGAHMTWTVPEDDALRAAVHSGTFACAVSEKRPHGVKWKGVQDNARQPGSLYAALRRHLVAEDATRCLRKRWERMLRDAAAAAAAEEEEEA